MPSANHLSEVLETTEAERLAIDAGQWRGEVSRYPRWIASGFLQPVVWRMGQNLPGADDLMLPPSKELCVVLVFSTQRSACSKG